MKSHPDRAVAIDSLDQSKRPNPRHLIPVTAGT